MEGPCQNNYPAGSKVLESGCIWLTIQTVRKEPFNDFSELLSLFSVNLFGLGACKGFPDTRKAALFLSLPLSANELALEGRSECSSLACSARMGGDYFFCLILSSITSVFEGEMCLRWENNNWEREVGQFENMNPNPLSTVYATKRRRRSNKR